MTKFTSFDEQLFAAINDGAATYSQLCASPTLSGAASALAAPDPHGERNGLRVIDRRLQALRRSGRIRFDRPTGQWSVVGAQTGGERP